MLRKLNKQAEKTFRLLLNDMKLHQSRIVDNSETFMKVHVEVINKHHKSYVVSITHYFTQEGDLCCDPDMTFLVNETGVYPLTFQQAIPPVYQEAARITEDGVKYSARLQRELTSFANQWMRNIQQQQF